MCEAAVAGAVGGVVEVEGLAGQHGFAAVVTVLAVCLSEERFTDALVIASVSAATR